MAPENLASAILFAIVPFAVVALVIILVTPWLVKLLWNSFLPDLVGSKPITYGRSIRLILLSMLLLGAAQVVLASVSLLGYGAVASSFLVGRSLHSFASPPAPPMSPASSHSQSALWTEATPQFAEHEDEFRACFTQSRWPDGEERIAFLYFTIGADGNLSDVSASGPEPDPAIVANCVRDIALDFTFPKSTGDRFHEMTLRFSR